MTITQTVSRLNEILAAEGDLIVEGQVGFMSGPIRELAQGPVHGVNVFHEEGQFKRVIITSDDGNAA